MAGRGLRSLGAVPLAVAVVAALGVPAAAAPGLGAGVKTVLAEAKLLSGETESWIMGGSGLPIPPPSYLTDVSERYIDPGALPEFGGGKPLFDGQPQFPVSVTNPLFTPEGLYPFTAVKNLELDPSVQQGVQILDSTIKGQGAAGNNSVVLGYSQSATINSLEMKDLLALPKGEQPTPEQLAFVLLGDPGNPNGGLLTRFDLTTLPEVGPKMPELTIPSLGITFYADGSTPAAAPWDTAVYTQEYDGFADFPKYPLNFLSDVNALLGVLEVHGKYPTLSTEQLSSANVTLLPGSADSPAPLPDGGTTAAEATNYFMIHTADLPLLDPLRGSPFGNAIADLLQPDLKVLVDLGYGNLDTVSDLQNATGGWDTGPANLPTPFGLFPNVNFGGLLTSLAAGAKMGWNDFVDDLHNMSTAGAPDLAPDVAAPSFTDIVNAFSSALSSLYAALLPTADIINALVTTLPNYDVAMFTQYLEHGDLLDAIGMPAAADTGLTTMAFGFELIAIENALGEVSSAFSGL